MRTIPEEDFNEESDLFFDMDMPSALEIMEYHMRMNAESAFPTKYVPTEAKYHFCKPIKRTVLHAEDVAKNCGCSKYRMQCGAALVPYPANSPRPPGAEDEDYMVISRTKIDRQMSPLAVYSLSPPSPTNAAPDKDDCTASENDAGATCQYDDSHESDEECTTILRRVRSARDFRPMKKKKLPRRVRLLRKQRPGF